MYSFQKLALLVVATASLSSCATKRDSRLQHSDSKINEEIVKEDDVKESGNNIIDFLEPVPREYIVSEVIDDSVLLVFTEKCVVFSNYSSTELAELEQRMTEEEWEAFYDDMAYYGNEASLFLYEKTRIERVYDQKYFKFIFESGREITIDRQKSLETIFFFNPKKDLLYCDTRAFNKEQYRGY
jgi:hypothetical protein